MAPSLFVQLHGLEIVPLLTEWLKVNDVCALDSALTNTKLRQSFLICIACEYSIFLGVCDLELLKTYDISEKYLLWVMKRKIHMKLLNLRFTRLKHNHDLGSTPLENCPSIMQKCYLAQLQTLHIDAGGCLVTLKQSYIFELLKNTSCLQELQLSYFPPVKSPTADEQLNDHNNLNELQLFNLKKLSITGCKMQYNSYKALVNKTLLNLHTLQLDEYYDTDCGAAISAFVIAVTDQCAHSLTTLDFISAKEIDQNALTYIIQKCVHLQHINVFCSYKNSDDIINAIGDSHIDLKHLNMEYSKVSIPVKEAVLTLVLNSPKLSILYMSTNDPMEMEHNALANELGKQYPHISIFLIFFDGDTDDDDDY